MSNRERARLEIVSLVPRLPHGERLSGKDALFADKRKELGFVDSAQKKPDGVRGLSWDEISVRGIYMGQKGPVALIQGPDTKTYQVKVGDQLYDALVKAITADSLVVLQEVNDPLSLQKQRERRKSLRVAEEVK
jgi:hypothetical protein